MKKSLILLLTVCCLTFISCDKSDSTKTTDKPTSTSSEESSATKENLDKQIDEAKTLILDTIEIPEGFSVELEFVDGSNEATKNLEKYSTDYFVFFATQKSLSDNDSRPQQVSYAVKKDTSDIYVIVPINDGDSKILTYDEFKK